MAKKFYAVKVGKVNGIFTSWDECKESICGYPGAQYKGFMTREEAEDYLLDKAPEDKKINPDCAVAYVDGSYNPKTTEFSYGAVLFFNGEVTEFNGAYNNPEVSDMRNVAGELKGAMMMMAYCVKNGIKALEIHHDYEGIAKWYNGQWKTNTVGTKMYKQYCDGIKNKLDVTFVKVKGHSGDKYNDLADKLAKSALGIE